MITVIDLDGTIFKTYQILKKEFQKHFKKKKSLFSLVTGFGLTEEERHWTYKIYFYKPFAYLNLPAYPNAISTIAVIQKFSHLYFVSCRPKEFYDLTKRELSKLNLFGNLLLVSYKEKPKFILDLNPDIVIEDDFAVASGLSPQCFVFLFERAWNKPFLSSIRREDLENILVVKGWKEVREILGWG